jgi:two-component system, OmpR family, copper resistance phosphate regulon response regulator CusR
MSAAPIRECCVAVGFIMKKTSPQTTSTLLVVDDDDATQILIKAIFQRRNVSVECVSDGNTALSRLRRASYDAVILDLMLPGTNGFEIIRELKSRDRQMLNRVIVMTAVSPVVLGDFHDAGLVRRVMYKPFDIDELTAEVLSLTPAIFEPRIAWQPARSRPA